MAMETEQLWLVRAKAYCEWPNFGQSLYAHQGGRETQQLHNCCGSWTRDLSERLPLSLPMAVALHTTKQIGLEGDVIPNSVPLSKP